MAISTRQVAGKARNGKKALPDGIVAFNYHDAVYHIDPPRTAKKLRELKLELDIAIPAKTVDPTLLLATWNIREFGGTKSGGREAEPLYYIAEIISRFDIVAIQEVRDNLDALDELMSILGSWWKYQVSDVTLGPQGNNERSLYIYDTRKLFFGGLAGELVPEMKKEGGVLKSEFAFSRTPYLAGFKAGWFKFTLCTQHMYYGQAKSDDPQRLAESRNVVKLLKKRMQSKDSWANNSARLHRPADRGAAHGRSRTRSNQPARFR